MLVWRPRHSKERSACAGSARRRFPALPGGGLPFGVRDQASFHRRRSVAPWASAKAAAQSMCRTWSTTLRRPPRFLQHLATSSSSSPSVSRSKDRRRVFLCALYFVVICEIIFTLKVLHHVASSRRADLQAVGSGTQAGHGRAWAEVSCFSSGHTSSGSGQVFFYQIFLALYTTTTTTMCHGRARADISSFPCIRGSCQVFFSRFLFARLEPTTQSEG
jgi:hypothetical protein